MQRPERPADRIVRLMREANFEAAPATQIIFNGDGNILGDVTINNPPMPASDPRTFRVSAIDYIRSSCRCSGNPAAWLAYTSVEFGLANLDALTDWQLERVRSWCAVRQGQA